MKDKKKLLKTINDSFNFILGGGKGGERSKYHPETEHNFMLLI